MKINLQFFGGRGASAGGSSAGRGNNTEQAQSTKSKLTAEGQKAFDILSTSAGGVWRVIDGSYDRNVMMSNETFAKDQADKVVAEINNKIKEAGIKNSISSVEAYWSGEEGLRIAITTKRNASNKIGY